MRVSNDNRLAAALTQAQHLAAALEQNKPKRGRPPKTRANECTKQQSTHSRFVIPGAVKRR